MATASKSSAVMRERTMAMMIPTKVAEGMTKTSPSDRSAMPTFSLELLSKKHDILLSEVSKHEECLRQRTQLMCKLRETLETLLRTNGDLEERSRLRDSKLQALRTALAATAAAISASGTSSHALNLDAGSQKLHFCDALLTSLDSARAQLEGSCMGGEEELMKEADSYRSALAAYQSACEHVQMKKEDMSSVALDLQIELIATEEAEEKMTTSSHTIERENLSASETKNHLDTMKQCLDNRRIIVDDARDMLLEELQGLRARKYLAEKDQCEVENLLRKSGAALPEDFEVEETARLLGRKLELLTAQISEARLSKRDAVLQRKEEVNLLAVAKSNVASREDQLKWLERQLSHLQREHKGRLSARQADQEAFNTFKHGHDEQMATIEQYLASIARETTTIMEEATLAHASISRTRIDRETQSALLHSQEGLRDKRILEARRIGEENKRSEDEIQCLLKSLAKLESRQSELVTSVDRAGMTWEDEVSWQQRCAGATEVAARCADTSKDLSSKIIHCIDEKLADIRLSLWQDASRSNVDQLLEVTAAQIRRAKEEKTAEHVDNEKTLRSKIEELQTRYDDMVRSMKTRFADAIEAKRQEHERLLRELSKKMKATSMEAVEPSTASESTSMADVPSVAEPTLGRAKATKMSSRVSRSAKVSSAAGKVRRQGGRISPPTHDEVFCEKQGAYPGSTTSASTRADQSDEAQLQDRPPSFISMSSLASHHTTTGKIGGLNKSQDELLPPKKTEVQQDPALLKGTFATATPRETGQKQLHKVPKARQTKNTSQKSATKHARKTLGTESKRTPSEPTGTFDDSLATQSRRIGNRDPTENSLLRHSVCRLQGAQAPHTKSSQQPQASNRVSKPKTNAVKLIAKSTRPQATTKGKARKASQAVNWFADDSFSFS